MQTEFETLKRVQRRMNILTNMVEVKEFIENELARVTGSKAPHPQVQLGVGWVIAQDCAGGQTLFLADRGKVRDRWWTDELIFAFEFNVEHVAEKTCERYTRNNPRVLTWDEAKAADNQNRIIEEAATWAGTPG